MSRWSSPSVRLWALLALAGLAVCAWLAVVGLESSVTSDDGAYAVQAHGLARGSWSVPHRLADADPGGRWYPHVNSTITERGFFPAAQHPVWSFVDGRLVAIFGTAGLRILPVLGYLAAIASAWHLSTALHPRATPLLGAALAATSPLLFHAVQLWAHTVAAAAVGFLAVAIVRIRLGGGARWWLAAVAASGVGAAARDESTLLVGGLVLAAAAAELRRGRRTDAAALVAAGGVAAVVTVGSSTWASAITGEGAVASRAGAATVLTRLSAAAQTLVADLRFGGEAEILTVVAAACVAAAAILLRRSMELPATAALLAAALLWVVRLAQAPTTMATGLLGAFPVAVFGVVFGLRSATTHARVLLAGLGLGALGVLAVQYPEGGSYNWGGRFLLPALPVLAALAAGALTEAARTHGRRRLIVGLAAVVVVPAVAMAVLDHRVRHEVDAALAPLAAVPADAPVVTDALHLPRLDWARHPDRAWLRAGASAADRRDLAAALRRAGIDEVVLFVVFPDTYEALVGAPPPGGGAVIDGPLVVGLGGG